MFSQITRNNLLAIHRAPDDIFPAPHLQVVLMHSPRNPHYTCISKLVTAALNTPLLTTCGPEQVHARYPRVHLRHHRQQDE